MAVAAARSDKGGVCAIAGSIHVRKRNEMTAIRVMALTVILLIKVDPASDPRGPHQLPGALHLVFADQSSEARIEQFRIENPFPIQMV